MKEKLILLVEDNPTDAELTRHALWKAGIVNDVVHAASGEEGLDYLCGKRRYPAHLAGAKPGLVLLDLRLPGIDGFEVLSRIRSHRTHAKLPVIVLTGSWSAEDILMGHRLKADSHVCKSLDLERLADALEQLGLGQYLEPPAGVRKKPAPAASKKKRLRPVA